MDLLSLADAALLFQEPFADSTSIDAVFPPSANSEESASNQSFDPPPQKDSLLLERVGGGGSDPIGPRKRSRRGPAPRTPQQQARSVARRNARERKRVRLVNLGFATLRDHIPPSFGPSPTPAPQKTKVSKSSSGNNKKLSKVDTLRCAIEYIRQLREAIGFEDNGGTSEGFSSSSSPPDLSSSSPSYCTTPSPVDLLMSASRSPPMFPEESDDFLDMMDWTTL